MSLYRPTGGHSGCFYEALRFWGNALGKLEGKADVSAKSFILTLGIFGGGYLSNTMLDEVVEAAERYFHVKTSAYKTDSNGYIICSPEKPKIANNFSPLTRSTSGE